MTQRIFLRGAFARASRVALAICFAMASAHAGSLDILNQALGALKQSGLGSTGTPSPAVGGGSQRDPDLRKEVISQLDWLQDFPRAQLLKEFYNPFDRVVMPLSTPSNGSSRYEVPAEGKISIRAYEHREDDSPLLILKYYEEAFAKQGFQLASLCVAPDCKGLGNHYDWAAALDPGRATDHNRFPHEAMITIAYKDNTIAFIAVGKFLHEYTSFIKLVDGRITDRQAMDRWLASRQPVAIPAHNNSSNTSTAQEASVKNSTSAKAEAVTSSDLLNRLSQQKGLVVVAFTSDDKGCPFCVRTTSRFETLAQVRSNDAKFWRVVWQPYTAVFDDPLAVQFNITGVPTFITFKDGKPVRRVNGEQTAVQLGQNLVSGL